MKAERTKWQCTFSCGGRPLTADVVTLFGEEAAKAWGEKRAKLIGKGWKLVSVEQVHERVTV